MALKMRDWKLWSARAGEPEYFPSTEFFMRTAETSIEINRRLKARRIYDKLRCSGITPGHISRFTHVSWELAAEMAGYKRKRDGHIISATTKGMVAELYATYGGKAIPM